MYTTYNNVYYETRYSPVFWAQIYSVETMCIKPYAHNAIPLPRDIIMYDIMQQYTSDLRIECSIQGTSR